MASGIIDHQFGAGGHGYNLRMVWEEIAVSTADNTSTVKVTAQLIADQGKNITSTKTKTISITCNGVKQSGTCKVGISSGETKTLYSATFTVAHNADGSKTVPLVCRLDIDISISGIHVSYVQGSGNAVLSVISRTPAAPTTFTVTAGYGSYVGLGDTVTLTWSGASGNITGYEIQYSRGSSGWKTLKSVTGNSTTDSFTATDIAENGAGKQVKYRIRAMNGTLGSSWKESNILTITGGMDLKVSNAWKMGSVWVKVNGSWKRAKRVWVKVNGSWKYSK